MTRSASAPAPDPGRFEALSDDECWQLLATRGVARVAFQADEGLVLLPITFRMAGRRMVFGTRAGGVLEALGQPGLPVAVEVDELDEDTGTGWSIMMRGVTTEASEADIAGLAPWAGRDRTRPIGVALVTIGGRVVSRPE